MREGERAYSKVAEIDKRPGRSRGAAEEGEYEKPGEEKNEDVGRPDTRIHKPLRVLVQIRRRNRLHIELRHHARRRLFSDLQAQELDRLWLTKERDFGILTTEAIGNHRSGRRVRRMGRQSQKRKRRRGDGTDLR
ncbi:hypothetical protein ZIOFF_040094 [Zingiber officinale]|uniref:Uncharacterized protein n=1 Tax=Zingiber officinale TaxID=94328 RepID=A0A8J5G5R2_ZINOF|nr:hypothetical protein ZIOFF_040094 [Zingiber officinale]